MEEASAYFSVTVNGVPVVVQHAAGSYSCVSILEAGLHKISFGYKQGLGSEASAFYWQGTNNKLQLVPMNRFFSTM